MTASTMPFSEAIAEEVSLPQATEKRSSTFPFPEQQPHSLTTSPSLTAVSTDGFSLDSQVLTSKLNSWCSAINCQNPAAAASLKCQHCRRTYCPSCAPLSLSCTKSAIGHSFVSNLRNRGPRPAKVRGAKVGTKKPAKDEGLPWQCKHFTMVNGPQVLVCLGCDALRESEAQEGRNVCPMCTLVNEPGKTKCELCNTDLVSKEQVQVTDVPE